MEEDKSKFRAMPKDGFSAVSQEELLQFEGGILPVIYGVAFGVGMALGYGATKGAMEGEGGGEVLPGFTEFLVNSQRIQCGCK